MRESRPERGARLRPLADALAKRNRFDMPYESGERVYHADYYVGGFLVVTRRDDPNDRDDGYGCNRLGSSEWSDSAQDAARTVRDKLQYYGWRNIEVYDVERGERCDLDFAIVLKYQAVTRLTAVVGGEYMGDAPALSRAAT